MPPKKTIDESKLPHMYERFGNVRAVATLLGVHEDRVRDSLVRQGVVIPLSNNPSGRKKDHQHP